MDETIAHILQERRFKVQRNINHAQKALERFMDEHPEYTTTLTVAFEHMSEAVRELDTLR